VHELFEVLEGEELNDEFWSQFSESVTNVVRQTAMKDQDLEDEEEELVLAEIKLKTKAF
jgi:hypothetical protein